MFAQFVMVQNLLQAVQSVLTGPGVVVEKPEATQARKSAKHLVMIFWASLFSMSCSSFSRSLSVSHFIISD